MFFSHRRCSFEEECYGPRTYRRQRAKGTSRSFFGFKTVLQYPTALENNHAVTVAPCIIGLVSSGLGADLGPKSMIFRGILKNLSGPSFPAVLRTFLILLLSPFPPGWGRVRTAIFQRKVGVLGRFRAGSGGKFICYLYFGFKRSWV